MVADIRGIPNQYVLELDSADVSDQTVSAVLGAASRKAQTFAEFRTGGPFALKLTVIQNYSEDSVWDLSVNSPGSSIAGAFYPLGNAVGSPKFAFTATTAAPTSDEQVGGEGGAVDADSPTIETEWVLDGKWVQSTVTAP